MTDSQSIAVHALASRMLMSVSVDEKLLPWPWRQTNDLYKIELLKKFYHLIVFKQMTDV